MRRLDAQLERSVLYAAFGSEARPKPAHVREVVHGLDLAGVRFVWALRVAGSKLLPDGFEAHVAGRGVLRVRWAPQERVLAHAAMGAFMTHAGMSLIVEGLCSTARS
jgi:UDP:flavonoid glycosyltransferase YjiC (YdhE family)